MNRRKIGLHFSVVCHW